MTETLEVEVKEALIGSQCRFAGHQKRRKSVPDECDELVTIYSLALAGRSPIRILGCGDYDSALSTQPNPNTQYMITTKKILAGLFAAGVVSVGTSSAALTTSQGDLLLSFYTTSGSSIGANAYTINLGSGSSFIGGAASTIVNINTDLTTAFGAGWASDTTLTMNLIGGYSSTATPSAPDAARTIYAGSRLTDISTYGNSTPAKATSSTGHNTWATNVSGFSDAQNNRPSGSAVNGNSAIMAVADYNNDVTNYNNPTTVGLYYGIGWNPTTTMSSTNIGTFDGTTYEAALDVWKADRATWSVPTYATTIGLTSTGDLNIVATSAVPEPSTYAMAGVAVLTAGFMAIRRRKKASVN